MSNVTIYELLEREERLDRVLNYMTLISPTKLPTRKRIAKAGRAVRDNSETEDDVEVIDTWRSAHGAVLNTFQSLLRARARGKGVIVAQRHKRKNTIFDKLKRYPDMNLARMDDIAGCRLIFKDIQSLHRFRDEMHKGGFRHKLVNDPNKYDYISCPKSTGYRGIHDIYSYDVNSPYGEHLKGLKIEIQYRTEAQHAWATANEVIGNITTSQPKFQKGDRRYEYFMALASEMIARSKEKSRSCFPDWDNGKLVQTFVELDAELQLRGKLKNANSDEAKTKNYENYILVFDKELKIYPHRYESTALLELFNLEREFPNIDIVLVRAKGEKELKFAFKNYFTDAQEFVNLIDKGIESLSKYKIYNVNPAHLEGLGWDYGP